METGTTLWDDGHVITVIGGMVLVILLLLAAVRLGYLGGKGGRFK